MIITILKKILLFFVMMIAFTSFPNMALIAVEWLNDIIELRVVVDSTITDYLKGNDADN